MALIKRGEIEVVDPSSVRVQGYAAVTGNAFDYFDPVEFRLRRMTIDRGAFRGVLAALGDEPLPVYWSHGILGLQLGETTALREDDHGLYFEARPFATLEVVDQLTVLQGRSRTGASMLSVFGDIAEGDDGVEHIQSFDELFEVGPTPNGANPAAYAELAELAPSHEPALPAEPELATESTDAALAAAIYRAAAQIRRL